MAKMRAGRDEKVVAERLAALHAAAAADQNVIPAMLDCARVYCTLFEIRHTLEGVWGAYREPVFF
jgi:methylmalonyl-CoA mutase N-terminal domain/subunit